MIKGKLEFADVNKFGYVQIKVAGARFGADKKGALPANPGDFVEFEPFKNDRGYDTFKFQSFKKIDAPAGAPAPAASSGGFKPAAGGRDDYWANKDKKDEAREPRISYFAAFERAVQFSDLAIRNGGFDALAKAKPAAKLEILAAFVEEQTLRIMGGAYAATVPTAEEDLSAGGKALPADETAVGEPDESWS